MGNNPSSFPVNPDPDSDSDERFIADSDSKKNIVDAVTQIEGELYFLLNDRNSQPMNWRESINKIIRLLSHKLDLLKHNSGALFNFYALGRNVLEMEDNIHFLRRQYDKIHVTDSMSTRKIMKEDAELLKQFETVRNMLTYFEQTHGFRYQQEDDNLREFLYHLNRRVSFDLAVKAHQNEEEIKEFRQYEDMLSNAITKILSGGWQGIYRNDRQFHIIALIERYLSDLQKTMKVLQQLERGVSVEDVKDITKLPELVFKPGCKLFKLSECEQMTAQEILTQLQMEAEKLLFIAKNVTEWEKQQQHKAVLMDATRRQSNPVMTNKAKAALTSEALHDADRLKMLAHSGMLKKLQEGLVPPGSMHNRRAIEQMKAMIGRGRSRRKPKSKSKSKPKSKRS